MGGINQAIGIEARLGAGGSDRVAGLQACGHGVIDGTHGFGALQGIAGHGGNGFRRISGGRQA